MCEFGHTDRAQRRCTIADLRNDVFEETRHVETLALCFDHDAGVEDYSQDGGFHGLLRSRMPSSTSFMKPSSRIAVVPRASANAMHSDNNRPLGNGERITATAR